MKYFAEQNRRINFTIGYSNVKKYYNLCQRIIGQDPIFNPFTREELDVVFDEYERIQRYFNRLNLIKPLKFMRINQSLWAERIQAEPDFNTKCPKLGMIKNILWICPNGDISVCGYDDRQSDLIAGNILDDSILSIWYGKKRYKILDNIKNRKYRNYPCINPNVVKCIHKEMKYEKRT
jgi:hypothetical protein